MWHDAVDLLGKLGPFFIAIAVFASGRAQTRWSNALASRAAEIEDQKFRLSLMDRRVAALEGVQTAVTQFWIEGAVKKEAIEAAGAAFKTAELVFADEQRTEIEHFLSRLWKWQSLDRQLNRYRDSVRPKDEALYGSVVDEISAFETELLNGFDRLLTSLKEATRVRTVPVFAPPAMLPSRVWQRIRHRSA